MDVKPITLTGRFTQLVPMETEHLEALTEAGMHPEIWTYLPFVMNNQDDMARLVKEALLGKERGTDLPFVIRDLSSGKIVGSTRFLSISPPNRSLEIGWTWLNPTAWRTPINTECKYLLLSHAFESLSAVRMQFRTDARNIRSQSAIERIGAIKEGVWRKSWILPTGYIRDSVFYSVIAEEWSAVKTRLEGFLA